MKEYQYLGTLGMGSSPVVYRPSIEILISNNDKPAIKSIVQMAMVDSGSDVVLMDVEIAEYLEIDPNACQKTRMSGVTGEAEGFVAKVHLKVEQFEETIPVDVVFIKELKTGILLGQKGFFDYFTIIFDKSNNIFKLERNDVKSV